MKSFPRFFAFGRDYAPGEDYVRCDQQGQSVLVAPGVGEQTATDELSLERCLSFVNQGIMCETSREIVSRKPFLQTADRRQEAAGTGGAGGVLCIGRCNRLAPPSRTSPWLAAVMRNSSFTKAPAHIDAMKTFLDDTMRFDKADMPIHRQILCHQHIGVEPQRGQLEFFRQLRDES